MFKPGSITPRTLLTFLFVFVFFSNLPAYLFLFPHPEIKPIYWKLIFEFAVIIICLPEMLAGRKRLTFSYNPIFKWLIFYSVITAIWYLPTDKTEVLQLNFYGALSSALFIFTLLFLLSGDEKAQNAARYALLASVFLTVACNILEFFDPFLFVPPYSIFSNPGRSAGLYVNANGSGAALGIGMIFTTGLIPKKLRLPYVALIFLGIMLTFSRASITGWIIVVIAFMITRILTKKELLICVIGLVSLFLAATAISLYIHNYKPDFNEANLAGRIDWFSDVHLEDDSVSQRKLVAAMAWDRFTESPITGNGLGSTMQWSETVSTHNMYLTFMSDFGVTGIFVFPLLVLAVIWKAREEARQMAVPFAVFMLWQAFFSHNMLDGYCFMIAYPLMAAIAFHSRGLHNGNKVENSVSGNIRRAQGA